MSNKNKNKLLHSSISTVYEDCQVCRRMKTHLSVLILDERDLALNRHLDFMYEQGNKHQQKECSVLCKHACLGEKKQHGLRGGITKTVYFP